MGAPPESGAPVRKIRMQTCQEVTEPVSCIFNHLRLTSSKGQRDRFAIMRGLVPKPRRFGNGTTPRGIRFAIPLPS